VLAVQGGARAILQPHSGVIESRGAHHGEPRCDREEVGCIQAVVLHPRSQAHDGGLVEEARARSSPVTGKPGNLCIRRIGGRAPVEGGPCDEMIRPVHERLDHSCLKGAGPAVHDGLRGVRRGVQLAVLADGHKRGELILHGRARPFIRTQQAVELAVFARVVI
jgi:hypothetical protein